MLSSFNAHLYDVFVKSSKPQPAVFKANKIDTRRALVHLDIKRCRATILKHSEWEWAVACAADELVECTVDNCYSLDYVWVEMKDLKTATKWTSSLPFQNSRFYHQSAVRFMLRFSICTFVDCKVRLRCTGRYFKLFKEPLEAIESVLPESMRKAAFNEYIGTIQIEEANRYIVRTASKNEQPLHTGKMLLKC